MPTPELPDDAYTVPGDFFSTGRYALPDTLLIAADGRARFLPQGYSWTGPDGIVWMIVYQTTRGGYPQPHWVLDDVPEPAS